MKKEKNDSMDKWQWHGKVTRPSLTKLDFDSLYMIFKYLNFDDLINVVLADESVSEAAAYAFKFRAENRVIQIVDSFDNELKIQDNDFITVVFYDYEMAILMVEYFGLKISNLEINFEFDKNDQVKNVVSLVNQFCKNLQTFKLITNNIEALDDVKAPFDSVVDFTFFEKHRKIGNDMFDLNEMFPKLQRLYTKNLRSYDGSIIKIPHLESIGVEYVDITDKFHVKHFKNLIKNNPQIKHIHFGAVCLSFVHFINNNLPKLESISIINIVPDDNNLNSIHFENVKTFKLERITSTYVNIKNITFQPNNLNDLECDIEFTYLCEKILRNNANITKFSSPISSHIIDNKLTLITEVAPNLIEARFTLGYSLSPQAIKQFLNRCKYLMRLDVFIDHDNYIIQAVEEMKPQIENKWTVLMEKNSYKIQLVVGQQRTMIFYRFQRKI